MRIIFAEMLISLHHIKSVRIFWMMLSLFMLNISIDTKDIQTVAAAEENLAFNDQESMIELIMEQVFDIEDAFPETDDNDASQETTFKKHKSVDIFILPAIQSKEAYTSVSNNCFEFYNSHHSSPSQDIVSPPPEI